MRRWIDKAIALAILVVVVVVIVIRAENRVKDPLPEGSEYIFKMEKRLIGSEGKQNMTLTFDSEGRLLYYQTCRGKAFYTYDDQGKLLSHYSYDNIGAPGGMYDYIYDEAGRLVKKEGYYISKDYHSFYYTYSYDTQGNLIGEKYYSNRSMGKRLDEIALSEEWVYAANGDLLEWITYDEGNHYRYTYAEDGKRQNMYQERKGQRYKNVDYDYNEQGLLSMTVTTTWKDNKATTTKCNYTYDENGNLVNILKYHGDVYSCDYTYDAMGNVLSHVCRKNGDVTRDLHWEYDEAGRMINFDDSRFWTYDADGNVTIVDTGSSGGQDYVYEFSYSWPEGEIPQVVMEQIAQYIAQFVDQYHIRPEIYDHS